MWWMNVWIICNLGVVLDWTGVFYWTGDIQSQIWSGQLSSATPVQSQVKSSQDSWLRSPCCPSSSLRLIKQFQLLLRTEWGLLELRRWGRLRHERGSSETWYYQLPPQNIRDTAISRANNHTICSGRVMKTLRSHPVVPVLPLSRFPTNCGPKARYEHQISETRVDARHRAGTELLGPGSQLSDNLNYFG